MRQLVGFLGESSFVETIFIHFSSKFNSGQSSALCPFDRYSSFFNLDHLKLVVFLTQDICKTRPRHERKGIGRRGQGRTVFFGFSHTIPLLACLHVACLHDQNKSGFFGWPAFFQPIRAIRKVFKQP